MLSLPCFNCHGAIAMVSCAMLPLSCTHCHVYIAILPLQCCHCHVAIVMLSLLSCCHVPCCFCHVAFCHVANVIAMLPLTLQSQLSLSMPLQLLLSLQFIAIAIVPLSSTLQWYHGNRIRQHGDGNVAIKI